MNLKTTYVLICLLLQTIFVATTLASASTVEDDACYTCHKIKRIDHKAVTKDKYEVSGHGVKKIKCVQCHVDYTDTIHPLLKYKYDPENYDKYQKILSSRCKSCHKKNFLYEPYDRHSYEGSVHKDNKCSDCHDFIPDIHEKALTSGYFKRAHQACPRCHKKEAKLFKSSHHKKALSKGKKAPDCVLCHGSHWIQPVKKKAKTAAFKKLMLEYCSECHPERTKSGNFHFQAINMGNSTVPSCFSCHGAHDNEKLTRNSPETVKICKRCHKDEKPAFFKTSIHGLQHNKGTKFENVSRALLKKYRWLSLSVAAVSLLLGALLVFKRVRSGKNG